MLLNDDNEMYNGPVSNDREEGLECVFKESSGTAADCDRGDEAKCDKGDARHTESPWTEVLSMHCKGVVVRDVVLTRLVGCFDLS